MIWQCTILYFDKVQSTLTMCKVLWQMIWQCTTYFDKWFDNVRHTLTNDLTMYKILWQSTKYFDKVQYNLTNDLTNYTITAPIWMQVRMYCRSILVKLLPRQVRASLIERLQLTGRTSELKTYLSLFNHTPPETTLLLCQRGHGGIDYNLQQHNHCRMKFSGVHRLRVVVNRYFRQHPDYRHVVFPSDSVSIISSFVRMNGRKWRVGQFCEFASSIVNVNGGYRGRDPPVVMAVGKIVGFIVVRFSSDRRSASDGQYEEHELFVRLMVLNQDHVTRVTTAPWSDSGVMYMYRVPRIEMNRGKAENIHASLLYSLLSRVRDNKYNKDFRNLLVTQKAFSD